MNVNKTERTRVVVMTANLVLFFLATCGIKWCEVAWFVSYPAAFSCAIFSARRRART